MSDQAFDTRVELWTAKIPFIGRFAEHHWLVICQNGRADRWEVWQSPNKCTTAWDHLHLNLKSPASGVGNGPGWRLRHWQGKDAVRLAERIESAPEKYPWSGQYRVFPGPNSNTFVQWVIGPEYILGWRGIGSKFAFTS